MDNRFLEFGNFAPYTFFFDHQNGTQQIPPNPYQPYFNHFMGQGSFNGYVFNTFWDNDFLLPVYGCNAKAIYQNRININPVYL